MKSNLYSALTGGSKLNGSLQVGGASLKVALGQEVETLGGSIGGMNLYDYYTKEEIDKLFGEIVTIKKESYFDFPNIGEKSVLYMDVGAGGTYIWDEDVNAYQCVGRDYEKIQEINGGNANG